MYVDVKTTVWQRIRLNEDENVSAEDVIELLKKVGVSELWNDLEQRFDPDWETLTETENYMSLEDNGGLSTIELYNDDDELLWENMKIE